MPDDLAIGRALLRLFNAIEKPKIMVGQTVRPRAFAEQGDLTKGRVTVPLSTLCDVRDSAKRVPVVVFGSEPDMLVATSRHTFRPVEM